MDVQMKRGLLDVCVLAAIQSEDSYGYQIIKDIRPYVDVSESTLYPILRRLEEGRLLTVRSVEHNGRLRKYYHITEAGSNAGIPVCLCGEIAADPLLLPVFIGMGLKSFSVSTPYISELKRRSAGITEEKGRDLANQVFCMDSEELLETLQKFS